MPNEFTRLAVTKPTKRDFDLLAAAFQRPVYEIAAEAVEAWKRERGIASVEVLPRPEDAAQAVPVVIVGG